jgi:hypothetical protein
MAKRIDDPRTRLEVLHVSSAGLARFSPVTERAPLHTECLELATRLDEPLLALRARLRLIFDLIELGDAAQAWLHAEIALGQARTYKNPRLLWPAMMLGALRAAFEGKNHDRARIVAEVEALASAYPQDALLSLCLRNHQACAERQRGFGDLTTISTFSSGNTDSVYDRVAQLSHRAQLGPLGPELAPALDQCLSGTLDSGDTALALWLAEMLVSLRSKPHAGALYAWMLPYARFNALWTMHGMFVLGPVGRGLSQLATVLGRMDEARKHAQASLEAMRLQGARPHQAHLLMDLAALHDAANDSAAAARARAEAAALGKACDIDFSGGPTADRAGEAVTFTREGEFWTVCGRGAVVRLKHGRGVEMLSRLVARPTSRTVRVTRSTAPQSCRSTQAVARPR